MPKKLTKEIFIERAREIHGDKYDYSKVEYVNSCTKVCIICPVHGEFWQEPSSHIRGNGCPKCGFKTGSGKRTKSTDYFISEAKRIHGNRYDYSKVKYINAHTKVCIICPVHGEFWQEPSNHLNSNGCYSCGRDNFAKTHNKSVDCFISEAKQIHGDRYDYSKVEYKNALTAVCIICPVHGEFWQRPIEHLRGCGCPVCNESHLERDIRLLLEEKKINYIYQCKKKNLKWLGKQSLDFYLPKYNIAIECQGEQHFRPINYFGGKDKFELVEKNDFLKQELCKNNNIIVFYFTNVAIKNVNENIYNKNNFFVDKNELINKLIKNLNA